MAGGEDDDFPLLPHFFEESDRVWSYIETHLIIIALKVNCDIYVCIFHLIFKAVDQGLVQIQEKCFLTWFSCRNSDQRLLFMFFKTHFYEFVLKQHLHRLSQVLESRRKLLGKGSLHLAYVVVVLP